MGSISINYAAGFNLAWDGNSGDYESQSVPDNWALSGTAGASSEYGVTDLPEVGYHLGSNLNDGSCGNYKSWICAASDATPSAWVIFPQEIGMTSFAFGRDNAKSMTATALSERLLRFGILGILPYASPRFSIEGPSGLTGKADHFMETGASDQKRICLMKASARVSAARRFQDLWRDPRP